MQVACNFVTNLHSLKETMMASIVKLSVDKDGFSSETYRFDGPMEFVVGRAKDCDVQLPNISDYRDISLHHCALHIEPPKIWLNVFESKAGVFVNELKISPTVGQIRLYDEDEVQLGQLRMTVHIVEHDVAESIRNGW